MADRQYILEHYVVNYVVRNLFPLGPQTSTYYAPKSIFDEFALLVIHYSLLRTLLVGISGYHRTHFGDAQIVKTIQSFAKDIEHNMAFLKRISGSLAESNMADMAHLAVLLKD